MRKKLSLLLLAFMAVSAYAAKSWKVTATTPVAAETKLIDNDAFTLETAFATSLGTDARTINGNDFTNYIQVRTDGDLWSDPKGTAYVDPDDEDNKATTLILTAKKDVKVTFHFGRGIDHGETW